MVIASYALIFFGGVTALGYLIGRGAAAFARGSAFQAVWAGSGPLRAGPGGAASILLGSSPGNPSDETGAMSAGLSRALDGATMIFLEMAFVTLFTGTILGAVWADVSWGRPWGWDPKEVFALNTWIVLLVLVHVRLKVRDKALWTAVLALLACGVMLFNWIAINFVVTGLHSYA
jgi:ABC-type transport system involved in cytochrome c biogenesis permease subunit